MVEKKPVEGTGENRSGLAVAESRRSELPGKRDVDFGAINLALVLYGAATCLVCFLLYLAWTSFTAAAPTVLWREASAIGDPLLYKEARRYAPDVSGPAEKNPEQDEGPAAGQPSRDPAIVERGQRLFRRLGCPLCHGREGQGGVTNPNYVKDTFPSFEQTAAKLGLEFPEDVEVVKEMLASGASLDNPAEIDVPDGAGIIAARYQTLANVILNGNQAMKKDPGGPEPIFMPSYQDTVSKSEMNQLLASFLVLYPIKEEAWDEEESQP